MTSIENQSMLIDDDTTPCLDASARGQCNSPSSSSQKSLTFVSRNADIWHEIFQHLSVELEDETSAVQETARRSLFNAARACKSLSEPALSALWRVLPSLANLFRLLPSFTKVNGKYHLGQLRPQNLLVLNKRCRQVRVILLRCDPCSFAPFTLVRLQQCLDKPISPALRKISIAHDFDTSSSSSSIPFLCLSPSVGCIALRDNSVKNEEFFASLLTAITTECLNLTHLMIVSTTSRRDIQALSSLVSLQDLDLTVPRGDFPTTLLVAFGRLPSLRRLVLDTGSHVPLIKGSDGRRITLTEDTQLEDLRELVPLGLFKHLEYLKLLGHPDAIVVVLLHMTPSALQCLHVHETNDDALFGFKNDAFALFTDAAKKLTILTTIEGSSTYLRNVCILSVLTHLTYLEISPSCTSLDDDGLLCIARSLTGLKTMLLPERCCDGSPSFKFLWTPNILPNNLESLRISVDSRQDPCMASTLPDLSSIEVARRDSHLALRTLSINSSLGDISLEVIAPLSRIINTTYPKLDIIQGFGVGSKDEPWDKVDIIRATLREACELVIEGSTR